MFTTIAPDARILFPVGTYAASLQQRFAAQKWLLSRGVVYMALTGVIRQTYRGEPFEGSNVAPYADDPAWSVEIVLRFDDPAVGEAIRELALPAGARLEVRS